MNLKHLTDRIKNASPKYWSDVSQAELDVMRSDAKNSWMSRCDVFLMLFAIFLGATAGGAYYFEKVQADWQVNAFLAYFGVVTSLFIAIIATLGLFYLIAVLELIFGDYNYCLKHLNSLEEDFIACEEVLKLSKIDPANQYRLQVLKKGRNLIQLDVRIMDDLAQEYQSRHEQENLKQVYNQIHLMS